MVLRKNLENLQSLLKELVGLNNEAEWVEFKRDNADPKEIGEYISALANSAALVGKPAGYVLWGIEDATHHIVGTSFKPSTKKHKQQELENWLLQKLSPKIDFVFHEFKTVDSQSIVILEIQAASHTPVKFDNSKFIRVGSYKKKLHAFPEKERELWRVFDSTSFEQQIAAQNLSTDQVLKQLDYPTYFDLLNIPLPEGRQGILDALAADFMIKKAGAGQWDITNLGAILFAKKLKDFQHLARKVIRLILYKGNGRTETIREHEGSKGYAVGFEGLINTVKILLPSNEEIGQAFRREVPMYPELAIRELVANALIHQDFSITGTGPMIELFDRRMEITNPGLPLVDTDRFLDTPPRSRNEALAAFMRRINICEERGSGIDKVVAQTEIYQLPAPIFEQMETHTKATLFSFKAYGDMDTADRVKACYLHCCLKYVQQEPMNNASICERFKFSKGSSAMASRVIKQTIEYELIRLADDRTNRRFRTYVPFWA